MNTIQKSIIITLTAFAPFLGLVTRAYADGETSLVITGNGAESSNVVHADHANNTNVTQNNDAHVDNTVNVTANTGDNKASDNTSDNGTTDIKTGDVQVNTQVTNQVNNSVATANNCCQTNSGSSNNGGTAVISGNGAGSDNTVSISSSFNTNATVTNNANITNNNNGYANTGGNTANDNNGDVSITTGDINVQEKIVNKVNKSFISLGLPFGSDFYAKISGNGAFSTNNIDTDMSKNIAVAVNNNADIFNNEFWKLTTGDNTANNNNGNVAVNTGDIDFQKQITNEANVSEVVISCCPQQAEQKPEAIVPPEKPSAPKPSENQSSSGPTNNQVQAAAAENVLPVTGNLWFFLALIGNIAMLIFGTYLRLRSGRSPSVVVA